MYESGLTACKATLGKKLMTLRKLKASMEEYVNRAEHIILELH
jgi:hypothetical protein